MPHSNLFRSMSQGHERPPKKSQLEWEHRTTLTNPRLRIASSPKCRMSLKDKKKRLVHVLNLYTEMGELITLKCAIG